MKSNNLLLKALERRVESQHSSHQALTAKAGIYLQKLITDMEYE